VVPSFGAVQQVRGRSVDANLALSKQKSPAQGRATEVNPRPSTLIAPILISMLVAHMTPVAHFFELPPPILRLPAVLAVFANRLIQILLGSMHISLTMVIPVSMGRNRGSS
jgi:hypothetical protein